MKQLPVVKVCGLTRAVNIEAVVEAGADLIGFIFVPESARYVGNMLSPVQLENLSGRVVRVGVFRDASHATILEMIRRYYLDAVQLHGQESVVFCRQLREYAFDIKISRAFSVSDEKTFAEAECFSECCDWFVFDAPSLLGGGSGMEFNWNHLVCYGGSTPFLLAGGVGPHNVTEALSAVLSHPSGWGIDINSKVETETGVKSVTLTKSVIEAVRHYGLGK
jgi:phosphoribosylanthranilate isomerase